MVDPVITPAPPPPPPPKPAPPPVTADTLRAAADKIDAADKKDPGQDLYAKDNAAQLRADADRLEKDKDHFTPSQLDVEAAYAMADTNFGPLLSPAGLNLPNSHDNQTKMDLDERTHRVDDAQDKLDQLDGQLDAEIKGMKGTLTPEQEAAFKRSYNAKHADEYATAKRELDGAQTELASYVQGHQDQITHAYAVSQAPGESSDYQTSMNHAIELLAGSKGFDGSQSRAELAQTTVQAIMSNPEAMEFASVADTGRLDDLGLQAVNSQAAEAGRKAADQGLPQDEVNKAIGNVIAEKAPEMKAAAEKAESVVEAHEKSDGAENVKQKKEALEALKGTTDTLVKIGAQIATSSLTPDGFRQLAKTGLQAIGQEFGEDGKLLEKEAGISHVGGAIAALGTIAFAMGAAGDVAAGDWSAVMVDLKDSGANLFDSAKYATDLAQHFSERALVDAEIAGEAFERFSGAASIVAGTVNAVGDISAFFSDQHRAGHVVAAIGDGIQVVGGTMLLSGNPAGAVLVGAGTAVSFAGNKWVEYDKYNSWHDEAKDLLTHLDPDRKGGPPSLNANAADYLAKLQDKGQQADYWSKMGFTPEQIQSLASNKDLTDELSKGKFDRDPQKLAALSEFVQTNFKRKDGTVDANAAFSFIQGITDKSQLKEKPGIHIAADTQRDFFDALIHPWGGSIVQPGTPYHESREATLAYLNAHQNDHTGSTAVYDYIRSHLEAFQP